MIAGLERPTSGRITLAGEDQTEASVQERRIGFVFQHYALFRHMTVRQNVAFGLKVRKEAKDETAKRVDELLELVQLAPFARPLPRPAVRRTTAARGARASARADDRRCCCWTSRSARWTLGSARSSDGGSTICTASSASRACS